ncbi:DUF3048 domain-containing protein [Paenibacillus filicis]|uniref:DUF3048 domain-containing protein n=1 Tax=Paenibacillus gyeongsangnamensis TaxID=3388067 RepID=A0ABT4QH56_9BACL|nr:DUF3048 domain-containing protein [Paenibacillus filicis]MCZ8516185.1 DUF3048 domain-containing protein [Paenibacillus filicis]
MKRRRWKSWRRLLRRGGLAVLAGALAYAAAGCEPPGRSKKPAVPATAQPGPAMPDETGRQAEPPPQKKVNLAPLTGLETAEPVTRRPVMVMINNHPSARPQSGLSQADLIYECLSEGEITRLVALFQSRRFPDPIGPVRSIRPYFIELGKGVGALQVHAGGSPDGYAQLEKERIPELDEITNAGQYFWRESFRKAPHNLYTNLDKIEAGAAKRGIPDTGPDKPVFLFDPGGSGAVQAFGGESVSGRKLEVTFLLSSYKVGYAYDEGSRTYKRSINGIKHIDLNNHEQLSAANVIVMGTDHRVLDEEGRLDVRLTGTGPALLFQNGKARIVEWKRTEVNEPVRCYEKGQEVTLRPGQTHILIVPMKPSFEGHVQFS